MKNNIKNFLSLIALLVLVICFGNMVMAENDDVIENEIKEIETIFAEDIGIKEIEKEVIEEHITDEIVTEDKTMDEASEYKEEIPVVTEEVETEEIEVDEKYEGYKEGVYFEPNCFGDCDLHECCYICPECTIEEEVFYDEEINPNDDYVLSKTCIICGHGTCEPVDEEFADNYYAE